MERKPLWNIMQTSRDESGGDVRLQMCLIMTSLTLLGAEATKLFVDLVWGLTDAALTVFAPFDSVFCVEHQSEEDDLDYAMGLLTAGEAVYEQALAETDPEALSELLCEHNVTVETGEIFRHFIEELESSWGEKYERIYWEKSRKYVAGQDLGNIRDDLARLTEDASSMSDSLYILRSCLVRGRYQDMDKELAARMARIIDDIRHHLDAVSSLLDYQGMRNMSASLRFLEEIGR